MASTGWTYPGTAANVALGSGIYWGSVNNARTINGAYASVSEEMFAGNISALLRVTDFGFAIPQNHRITGVEVLVYCRAYSGPGTVSEYFAQLVVGGAAAGQNKASGTWPDPANSRNYGGATDLWGLDLTPAQVNASNFGFHVAVQALMSGGAAGVDAIGVNIHHEPRPRSQGLIIM